LYAQAGPSGQFRDRQGEHRFDESNLSFRVIHYAMLEARTVVALAAVLELSALTVAHARRLRGSVKGRVVLQWRAVELPVHHQPDDCNQREDKHSRTQEQHDRKDRTANLSDLSLDRISHHWSSPYGDSRKPRIVVGSPSNGSQPSVPDNQPSRITPRIHLVNA
jgi:hypothetical protein